MPGFRLKMATQLGEKVAAEAGFTQFPVDPRKIAESKGITVQAKPAHVKGVSGALIFAGNDVTLIYSSEYNNAGFENFCIGHELGHYFLPGHPEEIMKQGGSHISRADFTQTTSIELEADHFASGRCEHGARVAAGAERAVNVDAAIANIEEAGRLAAKHGNVEGRSASDSRAAHHHF